MVESKAPPDISDKEVILIPYADNLNVAGIDELRVQEVKDKIVRRLRQIGFRVREELEACPIGQSLGFLIDGQKGIVTPIPERLQKVKLALDWLGRRPWVSGKQVERLIGHCIHFMLLRRELLSVFRAMYDFVQKSYHYKSVLFPSAAREARWASSLLGLCSVDLKRTWSEKVTSSDASLSGIAVCTRELPREEVARIGAQREPWRYRYRELPPPREAALHRGDPFSDISTVKPLRTDLEPEDPFELNEKFLEVPPEVMQQDHWHEAFAVHMKHAEHITLLEARGVVFSLRHKFRSVQHFARRHLHFGDNMSMVLMISKGRSSTFPMLKVCRRLCALLLCTDSYLSIRWIPSELNVADKGSRRWEHLRKQHVAGRASERQELRRIHERCYPTRTGQQDHGQAAFSPLPPEEERQGFDDPLRQEAGREGKDSSASGGQKNGSTPLQGTDELGAIGSLRGGRPGLHTKNRGLETILEDAEAFFEGSQEIGRGLHQISQRHLRAGRRVPRRLKICGRSERCVPRLWPEGHVASDGPGAAGLGEGRPSKDTTSPSMGAGGEPRHEDEEAGPPAAGAGNPDNVHCLPEARRVSGHSEDRSGEADAEARVSYIASSSCRTTRGLKSWNLRGINPTGCHAGAMAGASPRAAPIPRSLPFRPGIHGDGECLETSTRRRRTGAQPRRAPSASPLWTFVRSMPPSQVADGDQSQRPMGRGCQSPSLRAAWPLESGISSPTTGDTKACFAVGRADEKAGPKVFHPPSTIDNGKLFIELFSGCARLSEAMAVHGFTAIAYDIDYGAGCDLLDARIRLDLTRFIKQHRSRIALIWLGTPCTRRHDGGPPPLRDDCENLWGFADLHPHDRTKVSLGNELLFTSKFYIDLACHLSIPWVMENPYTSRIWLTPQALALKTFGARLHETHFCCFGTPWRKATGLLEWGFPSLQACALTCQPLGGRCQHSGKRHVALSGRDEEGRWRTHVAQPYPRLLCAQIAHQLQSSLV